MFANPSGSRCARTAQDAPTALMWVPAPTPPRRPTRPYFPEGSSVDASARESEGSSVDASARESDGSSVDEDSADPGDRAEREIDPPPFPVRALRRLKHLLHPHRVLERHPGISPLPDRPHEIDEGIERVRAG